MTRVAVIGAGLFGSIIAHTLVAQGHSVVLFDDDKPGAGSKPAACLMKPSWFSNAMPKKESEAALALLDDLYGVEDIEFTLRPKVARATVHWVSPYKVLTPERSFTSLTRVNATVDRIVENGGGSWMVSGVMGDKRCSAQHVNKVIVAAGVWCNDILIQARGHHPEAIHVEGLQGRAGSAFLWDKEQCVWEQPFIAPWAPFKQIVAFDRGDGFWTGDGQSILPKNWTPEHSRKSLERCRGQLNLIRHVERQPVELHGIRPYVPNAKPCYLAEHAPNVWVCTGGAKNGTIAAAWAALELGRLM